mgnify:CR=1 FL=1
MSLESFATANANWLNNLALSVDQLYQMVTGAAYVMGGAFVLKAIYSLKVYGEARTMMSTASSIKEPITYLIIGAVFIYLPTGVSVMLNTTFADNTIMSYEQLPSGMNLTVANGGIALLSILQLVGIIAFVRGWVLVGRSQAQGSQPGGLGKGITHIFGGILLMNIVFTINILYTVPINYCTKKNNILF